MRAIDFKRLSHMKFSKRIFLLLLINQAKPIQRIIVSLVDSVCVPEIRGGSIQVFVDKVFMGNQCVSVAKFWV